MVVAVVVTRDQGQWPRLYPRNCGGKGGVMCEIVRVIASVSEYGDEVGLGV